MTKRLIGLFLCAAMLLPFFPAAVFASPAEQETSGGEYAIVIEGGTAGFLNKDSVFAGYADRDDVLSVSLTEKEGRTFKYWQSSEGTRIPEKNFTMLVGRDEYFAPVFNDSGDSYVWTLVKDGDCEEGKTYRGVNEKGDALYKTEYVNFGCHSFENCVYVDKDTHKRVCTVCGKEIFEEHEFESEGTVVKEPTHGEEGTVEYRCYGCDATVTSTLPRTEEHVFDGTWTVVEPSVDGKYGKRSRACRFCDHTETYWYLDIDYKSAMKDRYYEYVYSSGGQIYHRERYYHFVNGEGKDVYLMALQYSTSNGRDGDTTWIWMYIDDGDSSTLDRVYLSRSNGDTMGPYVQAVYGYVYDFEGYLGAIRRQDYVVGNMEGMGYFGNSMSPRDSSMLSWSDDWAEEFNNAMIPVTEDPSSFLTKSRWETEETGFAYEGFENCARYKKQVFGNSGEYNYITVDNATGLCVSKTDCATLYATYMYFSDSKRIIPAAQYDAKDENEREGYLSDAKIEDDIKGFCSQRNSFNSFTLTLPERPKAVRLQHDVDGSFDALVETFSNGQVMGVMQNNARVVWTADSESYPESRKIVYTFKDDNGYGKIFDRWEVWDFGQGKWVTATTDKSLVLNTYASPLTDVTFIRFVAHTSETTHHIEVTDGYFYVGGDYGTEYTEYDVPEGVRVELYCEYKYGYDSHWEDQEGQTLENYSFVPVSDGLYTLVYTEAEISKSAYAYDSQGRVWVKGKEENADTYVTFSAFKGTKVVLETAPLSGSDFDQFLGWYHLTWDKTGEKFTLLSTETEFEYTVDGAEGNIVAVWSDGNVSLEKQMIRINIKNGFISDEIFEDEDECGLAHGNAFSSALFPEYSRFYMLDDPNDENKVSKWTIKWLSNGSEEKDEREVDPYNDYPTEAYVMDQGSYDGGVLNVEGTFAQRCREEEHEWKEGKVTIPPTFDSEGIKECSCFICGLKKTETVPKLVKYNVTEGNGSEIVTGGNDPAPLLVIRSNADYDKFVEVRADGRSVPKKYYSVSNGSTVVTFTSDFAGWLGEGEHDVTLVSTDGEATASVTVTRIVKEYDLWVNGEKITEDNLTVQCGSGSAAFDPETNTLTLDNAEITVGTEEQWLYTGILTFLDETLNIVVKGDCSITETNGDGIGSYEMDSEYKLIPHNVKVTGDGKLTITESAEWYGYGFYVTGDLVLDGVDITVVSQASGVWVGNDLTVNNGKLDITVNTQFNGIVSNAGTITVNDSDIRIKAENGQGVLLGNDKESASLILNGGNIDITAKYGVTAEPDPADGTRSLGSVTVNGGRLSADCSERANGIPPVSYTLGEGITVLEGDFDACKKLVIGEATGDVDVPWDELPDGGTLVWGDANGDEKVSSSDIVRLKKYFAALDPDTGESTVTVYRGADANGDGKISSSDIVRLKKYFAALDPDTGESTVTLGPSA